MVGPRKIGKLAKNWLHLDTKSGAMPHILSGFHLGRHMDDGRSVEIHSEHSYIEESA